MEQLDSLMRSAKKYNWYADDGITDSALRIQKDGIIQIKDLVKRSWWQEFESALQGIQRSVIAITDGVPPEWCTNPRLIVIQTQSILRKTLARMADRIQSHRFDHFRRSASSLPHDYFMMYGRFEAHRETVMQELESRDVLSHSLYSRPALPDRPGRSIEHPGQDAPREFRYNHPDNFHMVIRNSQTCCCGVVLENMGFLADSDSTITEKSLWPILAQVPFVWAMAPNKIRQLRAWGFQPNDPARRDPRSLCEQLLYLRHEFQDPERSQRWQDQQGIRINHNLAVFQTLADQIDEHTHHELKRLG